MFRYYYFLCVNVNIFLKKLWRLKFNITKFKNMLLVFSYFIWFERKALRNTAKKKSQSRNLFFSACDFSKTPN